MVCDSAAVQATSSSSKKTGMIATWSGLWIPPYSASFVYQMSPSKMPGLSGKFFRMYLMTIGGMTACR